MAAAGATGALALEASSLRKLDVVCQSFDDFMAAFGLEVTYDAVYISWWMADYVRHGFTARSLGSRMGSLRRIAGQRAQEFPAVDSVAWKWLKDTERSLKKIDPTAPSRATVVGIYWIEKVLDKLNIFDLRDLRYDRCSAVACQTAVRALLAHAGMLRGCEHRSGLLLSDITTVSNTHVEVRIATRYSEKKKKTCEGRTIVLPVEDARWSAGGALIEYINRFHADGDGDATLFFAFSAKGHPLRHKVSSDKDFIKRFKPLVIAAGMPAADQKRVSNHSFRAGGATDYFVAGMSAEAIKAQGGWTTYCFLIYVRSAAEHVWRVAAQMLKAIRHARQEQGKV